MPLVSDQILSYLDHKTLKNIRLVCRAWNETINNVLLKEKFGAISQAVKTLDYNWRNSICKQQSIEFNMDENNFHGINNLDADLIAMGWSSLAVGFPSGTIKVFGRMNLCSEKDLFHGKDLKFLKLEGDVLISASYSLIKVWRKDNKHLNLQLWEPSATIEAEGLQKYVSFGSGKGMLVCWQILNDVVNENLSSRLNVWRLKPLNEDPTTGAGFLHLLHTESQTHHSFPSKLFVNEKYIVTVWQLSVTKPSFVAAPITVEIRSTADFNIVFRYTTDDCVDFKGLTFVNDIFPILVLQGESSKIELIDCTWRSSDELNLQSYQKKYLKCFCLGSNSKFAVISNSSLYRIVDFQNIILSAFQKTTNSSYINLGRISSIRGLQLNERQEMQNFQMDELSLLHIEGAGQNNGTVTIKLVLLDFLDVDAINQSTSLRVDSIPLSTRMQNSDLTSSLAAGDKIERGSGAHQNTTSTSLRLACGSQDAVGLTTAGILKSNSQLQQQCLPSSESSVSEQKTVLNFVENDPIPSLSSPTATRKRVATQSTSYSGLEILPSKFRLSLNRDKPSNSNEPIDSEIPGENVAKTSTTNFSRDRDHLYKSNGNRSRADRSQQSDRDYDRLTCDRNCEERRRGENLGYDEYHRSAYSLSARDRGDGRCRDLHRSRYYTDDGDSNERSDERRISFNEDESPHYHCDSTGHFNRSVAIDFRTSRDARQHRSKSVDRYYQSRLRDRNLSGESDRASSDRDYRHGMRQRDPREIHSQDQNNSTDNPSNDSSSLANAAFRQKLYNDQMDWAVQYNLNYLYEMRQKYPGSYTIWYQAYCAQRCIPLVVTRVPSLDGMSNSEAFRTVDQSKHNGEHHSTDTHQTRNSTSGFNLSQYSVYNIDDFDDDPNEATSNVLPTVRDLTPPKFTHPHVIGRFSCNGLFVCVQPDKPTKGVSATIEFHDLGILLGDLQSTFPGPLVPNQTKRQQVIAFCKENISRKNNEFPPNHPGAIDHKSYVLLWELLLLLVRQNGTFIRTDIVELLLKDQEVTEDSPEAGSAIVGADRTDIFQQTEESLTNTLRELLLFGNQQKALEWAMTCGLWGHALFLASKMDKRTESYVSNRFTSALPLADPLQTLYQLVSGRQPIAATSSGDENWRPHLAMIISNSSDRLATGWPKFDKQSIVMMGDTLSARGFLLAAHFCYLMADVEFGDYNSKKFSKLVLLGSSVLLPFAGFATNEAIQCTEIFEYARQLNEPNFVIPSFQSFKFLYATRLADHGRSVEALQYCEALANVITQSPSSYSTGLIEQVYGFASMLKYSDLHYITGTDGSTIDDPNWLKKLENTNSYFHPR